MFDKNKNKRIERKAMENFIGIDAGDKINIVCILDKSGKIMFEDSVENNSKSMIDYFDELDKSSIVLEAGSHSFWISKLLLSLGHDVFICNPRRLKAVTENINKSDKEDARVLAQLLHTGTNLLKPVHLGELKHLRDLLLIKSRGALVKSRTSMINNVRGVVKAFGERIPSSIRADAFHKYAASHLSEEIRSNVQPLIIAIGQITLGIKKYNQKIEMLIETEYPIANTLRTITGVGPITSLAFVLIIGKAKRFQKSRSVGPYLGLTPRRDQSGNVDKELPITKAGNSMLRSLLINCANYILGPFGPDNQLKRHGEKIKGTGNSKAQKAKAKVAVARKLCVTMHQMMISGKDFDSIIIDPKIGLNASDQKENVEELV